MYILYCVSSHVFLSLSSLSHPLISILPPPLPPIFEDVRNKTGTKTTVGDSLSSGDEDEALEDYIRAAA